jgi:serine/threonine-protein kinase
MAGLLATSFLAAALAIYQWAELLHTLAGGRSFCAINASFNCATVWESAFAKSIQRMTNVPVAGWGLVWGVTAATCALLLYRRSRSGGDADAARASVALTAVSGAIASVVLFLVTVRMSVYCITCLGTYALVLGYGVFAHRSGALKMLPRAQLLRGAGTAAAIVVVAYLLVLYPGSITPVEGAPSITEASTKPDPTRPSDPLRAFLQTLRPPADEEVRLALEEYKRTPAMDTSASPPRTLYGASMAAVRILEFFDIRCSHCKQFADVLHDIEATTPPGSFSLELREFPLDGSCNSNVTKEMVDSTGVRCAAAKALICIEATGAFRDAQARMFHDQGELTVDRVLEIVSSAGRVPKDELARCVDSPETQTKLASDVAYAMIFNVEGTPLVVINGRKATAYPAFVYALIMAHGDPNAPGWSALSPAGEASR